MRLWIGLVICGFLSLPVCSIRAEELVGRAGLGGYTGLYYPTMGLQERYHFSTKYGVYFLYTPGSRLTTEFEYHRAVFEPGLIVENPMRWPVDMKLYESPRGENSLVFNSFSVNGLYYFDDLTGEGGISAPYFHFGGGFCHYNSATSGLIWPGQTSKPLDPEMVIPAFEDRAFGLTMSLGLGVEVRAGRQAALDIRARYNVVVGELRSMEAYGLTNVWPLQMIDVGIGIKYYIWKLK